MTPTELCRAYESGDIVGWLGKDNPELVREQFRLIAHHFQPFRITGQAEPSAGKKVMLYQAVRAVLGKDTDNYPQQVGDCFVAGTLVLMGDGSQKPIEDVKVGDRVVSHTGATRAVTNTIAKPYGGALVTALAGGRTVTATPDHLFATPAQDGPLKTRWLAVGDLSRDSKVLLSSRPDGTPLEAISSLRANSISVYCLEVEEDHSFIANGFAVHNCVAFGAKNATEYLTCLDMLMRGKRFKWRPVFPPYYYGTGRVYIGNSRIFGDGSLGGWMAAAVQKYGTLFSDEKDVPKYAGSISRAWGDSNPRNDLDNWKQTASPYLVKSAALIKSWGDLVEAICNGYPCTTASNVGYSMEASSDGFHRQTTSWPHQMAVIGLDDNDKDPYAIILNSWGPGAHGKLKDFDDGHDLPGGVLRVRRKDVEKHIRAEETFAFSNFNGFPAQDIDKALFKIF